MNDKLIEKYSPRIQDAIDYIEERRNVSPKRHWTPEQRQQWKLISLECPLCNEKYSKTNPLTKEHIHPTVLGGYERETNIIPLCEKCNFARNTVMIALLGTPKINDIRNRWPAIKPSLQIFIIWCHASINGDKDALNQCSGLNLAFSQERKITFPFASNESQTQTPTKEKLSFWKRAENVGRNAMKSASESIKSLKPVTKTHHEGIEELEKIVLQCQGQGCEQQLRIPKEYIGKFCCPKCKHEHLGTDSSLDASKKSITDNTKSKSSQKTENTLPIEEFQRIILDHLELQPILGSELGIKIALYMEIEGHEKCNSTEFLKLYGIPRGFKKAIQKHLEGLVIITGTGAGYSIAKAKPIAKAKSIPGFSTARNPKKPSMLMPLKNRTVYKMLVFFESKRNICFNWVELKELIIASELDGKTRTVTVHNLYKKSVDQLSDIDGDEIDWSQIEVPQIVVDLMREKALQSYTQRESLQKYNNEENRQKIKDYFNEIKEMLSPLKVKNTPKELNNNSPQKQEQEMPQITKSKVEKALQKEPSTHNIVAFRTKILELLPSEKISLNRLATNIGTYMKSNGYSSNYVSEFLKIFELPSGLKRAIEKHMSKEVIVSGEAPKYFVQKKVSEFGTRGEVE
jgi:5-methylcytosine-specific restriction endonuclease McrA